MPLISPRFYLPRGLPNRIRAGSLLGARGIPGGRLQTHECYGENTLRVRKLICSLAAVLCCFAGNAAAQDLLRSAPLRIFDATELTPDRYTVVKRLWVENWRSAFGIRAHGDSSAAIAALSAEAERLGADALTHLTCLNDDRAWLNRGYFCYGLAIKLR